MLLFALSRCQLLFSRVFCSLFVAEQGKAGRTKPPRCARCGRHPTSRTMNVVLAFPVGLSIVTPCLSYLRWFGFWSYGARVRNRYEYGTEEADRRVKRLGYCRVHMPSIPRTGSTWFRAMFETATSQPSFSMWPGKYAGREFRSESNLFTGRAVCCQAGVVF